MSLGFYGRRNEVDMNSLCRKQTSAFASTSVR
jgi:hypothetical protein